MYDRKQDGLWTKKKKSVRDKSFNGWDERGSFKGWNEGRKVHFSFDTLLLKFSLGAVILSSFLFTISWGKIWLYLEIDGGNHILMTVCGSIWKMLKISS